MLLSTYTRNYFLPSLFNCKRTVSLPENCRPCAGPALSFWLIAGKERVEFAFHKGGDPAAGSPTATLLRLHPNHRSYRRRLSLLLVDSPVSGKTDFRGVTGGVYKARERIHPGMLIRNY